MRPGRFKELCHTESLFWSLFLESLTFISDGSFPIFVDKLTHFCWAHVIPVTMVAHSVLMPIMQTWGWGGWGEKLADTYWMGHVPSLLKVFSLSNFLWWALPWKTKIYMFCDHTHRYISYVFCTPPCPQSSILLFRPQT